MRSPGRSAPWPTCRWDANCLTRGDEEGCCVLDALEKGCLEGKEFHRCGWASGHVLQEHTAQATPWVQGDVGSRERSAQAEPHQDPRSCEAPIAGPAIQFHLHHEGLYIGHQRGQAVFVVQRVGGVTVPSQVEGDNSVAILQLLRHVLPLESLLPDSVQQKRSWAALVTPDLVAHADAGGQRHKVLLACTRTRSLQQRQDLAQALASGRRAASTHSTPHKCHGRRCCHGAGAAAPRMPAPAHLRLDARTGGLRHRLGRGRTGDLHCDSASARARGVPAALASTAGHRRGHMYDPG
eukprot:scaffold699_cov385-Prasinococcus_capsulatus_cf.AAC.27